MDRYENKLDEIYNILFNISENNSSLLTGNAGIALFLFYYSKLTSKQESYDKGIEFIETSLNNVNKNGLVLNFSGGIAGIGSTLFHLKQQGFIDDNINLMLEDYYQMLCEHSVSLIKENKYDYLHEGLGIALFLLFVDNDLIDLRYWNKLIEALFKTKEGNNKYKWISNFGNGKSVYNISLSHGMSSIVIILSKIYKKYKTKGADELIEKSIDYILSQKLPIGDYHSIYSYYALESTNVLHSSRLAWCYGDLGIGFALLHAGRVLDKKEWIGEAFQIFEHASKRRDLVKNRLMDASFCHGTAGVAHIFNRLYIDTKIDLFKDAFDYWIEETLKMAKFEDGLAGFKHYSGLEQGYWRNDYGFLEGIAGIGLTLISKVSDIEPAWDELFLLS